MAEKEQFDEFLGGSQSLPHEVSISQFVSARAHEISMMTYSIGNILHPIHFKLYFIYFRIVIIKYYFLDSFKRN